MKTYSDYLKVIFLIAMFEIGKTLVTYLLFSS